VSFVGLVWWKSDRLMSKGGHTGIQVHGYIRQLKSNECGIDTFEECTFSAGAFFLDIQARE
jgi:hypothetical protein